MADFVVTGKCTITTCQHCTTKTTHGCLEKDRRTGAQKSFTDKELLYYKGDPKTETVRETSTKRRNSVNNIKKVTTLYYFVAYINTYFKPKDVEISEELLALVDYSHLGQRALGFRHWMLPHLISDKVLADFIRSRSLGSDVQLKGMLNMTTNEFKSFREYVLKEFKEYNDVKQA